MFNKVILAGRLVDDPKPRPTKKGGEFLVLRIVSTTYIGNNSKEDLFINVVTFGSLAEKCKTYLKKGSPIIVEGRLRENRWATETGPKSTFEVIASSVKFLPAGKTKDNDKSKEEPIYEYNVPEEETVLEPF